MNKNELGIVLKNMYSDKTKHKTTMIHLFAIKYSKHIVENNIKPAEILKAADMPESYHTEISKGIRLAHYVNVKQEWDDYNGSC